jgi:hypothetical protein
MNSVNFTLQAELDIVVNSRLSKGGCELLRITLLARSEARLSHHTKDFMHKEIDERP